MRSLTFTLLISLSACHHAKPPTSEHCVNNTTLQFKRIDGYRDKYKAGTREANAVAQARYFLETARFVLTGKGIDGSGVGCSNGDRNSANYTTLMTALAAHERDVQWMETERGVRFTGVVRGTATWIWLKSSAPVAQNEANDL